MGGELAIVAPASICAFVVGNLDCHGDGGFPSPAHGDPTLTKPKLLEQLDNVLPFPGKIIRQNRTSMLPLMDFVAIEDLFWQEFDTHIISRR